MIQNLSITAGGQAEQQAVHSKIFDRETPQDFAINHVEMNRELEEVKIDLKNVVRIFIAANRPDLEDAFSSVLNEIIFFKAVQNAKKHKKTEPDVEDLRHAFIEVLNDLQSILNN